MSADDLGSGRMPDVCALSGRSTEWREPVRFGWLRPWVWPVLLGAIALLAVVDVEATPPWSWLALPGTLLLVFAPDWAPRSIEGRLPISPRARLRREAWLLPGRFVAMVGLLVVAGALRADDAAIGTLGLLGVAAGAALWWVGALRGVRCLGVRRRGGERWVHLSNLHPDFVEAYQAQFSRVGAAPLPDPAPGGSTLIPSTAP